MKILLNFLVVCFVLLVTIPFNYINIFLDNYLRKANSKLRTNQYCHYYIHFLACTERKQTSRNFFSINKSKTNTSGSYEKRSLFLKKENTTCFTNYSRRKLRSFNIASAQRPHFSTTKTKLRLAIYLNEINLRVCADFNTHD